MATVHSITARLPFYLPYYETDKLLTLGPPESMSDLALLDGKKWALFDFDFKRGQAIFLDAPKATDFSKVPFSYATHYEKASRLAAISFADFLDLAKKIHPGQKFVHLFNIAHCGSTLLHHVFNASGDAWCISEPMFTYALAMYRHGVSGELLQGLAAAGLRFLSLYSGADKASTIVVKHFSQATTQFELWHKAVPAAACLFLYRDALSWCNSIFGFVQRIGLPPTFPPEFHGLTWYMMSGNRPTTDFTNIADFDNTDRRFEDFAVVAWALHCQQYQAAVQNGVPMRPFRYNELNNEKEMTVAEIFKHCDLGGEHIPAALKAFDHDSHEGSTTSHDKPVLKLSAESLARIGQILSHPQLAISSDIILQPG